MGLLSGSIPWYTMMVLHKKVKLLRDIDDPMAVLHTHALAGALGGILTGFFAVPKLCRLFYMVPDWDKYIGLAYGLQTGRISAGFKQMGIQLGGIVFVICLNVVMTSIICLLIRLVVPLRLERDELAIGDRAIHGEEGFWFVEEGQFSNNTNATFENSKTNTVYDVEDYSSTASRGSIREIQMVV
ncbi:ammonium transporter 2 member 4-like [Ziziphus jujuba]|uniref:Ammonium transporter 2 member 4-like n=1 Tax=Ziziphus jujuba TaxID=326968 RepID=A0ABM3IBI4_ZIZJJ|nr:ammonium transporter 2 member 4-like [Ziziphus jujuba]